MTEAEIREKIQKRRNEIDECACSIRGCWSCLAGKTLIAELEAQLIVIGMAGRRPDLPDGKDYVDGVRGHQVFLDECAG